MPLDVTFSPVQVPPVGHTWYKGDGVVFGQKTLSPFQIPVEVTKTVSAQLPIWYHTLCVPPPLRAGLKVPFTASLMPLPNQRPPAGVARRLKGAER